MTFEGNHPSEEQLERYILRRLSADEDETIENHYLICGRCQKRLLELDTPELYELVAALRSIGNDSVQDARPALVPRLVPIQVRRPVRVKTRWIGIAAALILLYGAGVVLRFMSREADAPVARISSGVRAPATASESVSPVAADQSSPSKAIPLRTARIGFRSRRSLRLIPHVRFVAYRPFRPPAALEPIIEEPVLDLDLQLFAVAEIEEPLQFDTSPEILEGPKRSPWRRLFAAITKPFRYILSRDY
jgi:hypothetical protein